MNGDEMSDANTKHTKGEMKVSSTTIYILDTDRHGRECNRVYATVQPGSWEFQVTAEEVEANARRLALAWNTHDELVAACKAQMRLIEGLRSTNMYYRIGKRPTEKALDMILDADEVQKRALDAIAKVEARP